MQKKTPKSVTNEDLARMMAKGFEGVDQRFVSIDQRFEALEKNVMATKQDVEEILIKFDHVAYKFEVKDLARRVDVLERKTGVN